LASIVDDLFVLSAPTSRHGLTRGLDATRPRVRRSPRASWSRDHALDPAGRPNLDRWAGPSSGPAPVGGQRSGPRPGLARRTPASIDAHRCASAAAAAATTPARRGGPAPRPGPQLCRRAHLHGPPLHAMGAAAGQGAGLRLGYHLLAAAG